MCSIFTAYCLWKEKWCSLFSLKLQSWEEKTVMESHNLQHSGHWEHRHLLSPQTSFRRTSLHHFSPLFVAWWGGDGCIAPRSLWRNDVDIHKRIPVEHLEAFKKSCFITISRFYYPKMPPQKLSKADLQKFSPALYTKQDAPWEEKTVLLQHQRLTVLQTSHIFCLKLNPCQVQRCCVSLFSFLVSEGKTHLDHFKIEGVLQGYKRTGAAVEYDSWECSIWSPKTWVWILTVIHSSLEIFTSYFTSLCLNFHMC